MDQVRKWALLIVWHFGLLLRVSSRCDKKFKTRNYNAEYEDCLLFCFVFPDVKTFQEDGEACNATGNGGNGDVAIGSSGTGSD